MSSELNNLSSLAVVGATGLVGREFLRILEERQVQIPLRLFASEQSEGEQIEVGERSFSVEKLGEGSFTEVEAALFSVPGEITKAYVPRAIESDCLVVDDSSAYRMRDEVPLVVPQVNGASLRDFSGKLISTPNCVVTPLAQVLKPLHDAHGLSRLIVSTYQSVSGAGRAAYEELSAQTKSLLSGMPATPRAFQRPIAFNVLPQIGKVGPYGETDEEEKITLELGKILSLPELAVTATAVRVPTFCGHGMSVWAEFEEKPAELDSIREMLDTTPGLRVLDRPENHIYPTNLDCVGGDFTMVGRLRADRHQPTALSFWIVSDNLRKGSALNAVEILETLLRYRRMA